MKVWGGVPRVLSIPESSRTASRVSDSQNRKPRSYPPLAHQLLPHSLIHRSRLSGLAFVNNTHTWWYTRLDATVWATSKNKDVWMTGSRNPIADCCKGLLLRVRGLLTTECPAWGIFSVPSSFSYSTSRRCFGYCTLHSPAGRPVDSMSWSRAEYSFCWEVPRGQHLKRTGPPPPPGERSMSVPF